MKRTIITSIILAAAVLAGCNRNELRPDGSEAQGELSLQIVPEGDFTPMSGTKATDDVQVDVNEFSLSINSAEGGTVMSWSKFSEVPAVIGLDPGTYTVIAKSPGNKSVDWLQPKYEGSQEVTVTPGDVENITISCSLTNMKVTIQTTEKFRNEMEDYTVTVSSDKGGFLTFTKAIIEEGRSGYFDPSLLTIDLNATRKQQEGVEIPPAHAVPDPLVHVVQHFVEVAGDVSAHRLQRRHILCCQDHRRLLGGSRPAQSLLIHALAPFCYMN